MSYRYYKCCVNLENSLLYGINYQFYSDCEQKFR